MIARKRVAVLISGRGSNMEALIAASREPGLPVEIVAVLANRADAAGLETARQAGIETVAIAHRDFPSREAHDAAMAAELDRIAPDIVCLAGYMRLLTPGFVQRWQGRMINIHPSLLPVFPGLHTHRRALDAGVAIHGCTVHFVTEAMDDGPIIAQAAVQVLAGDDEDRLAARVLSAEHKLYPLALRLVAEGRARMEGGRTVYAGLPPTTGGELISPDPGAGLVDVEALARMTP